MWYQRATKVLALRRYFFIGLILMAIAFAIFGDRLLRPFSPVCEEQPVYRDDVPADLRAQLDALFAAGQLYCPEPPEGLKNLTGPVYWGSDGVDSVLFFQGTDLTGTAVERYGFGQDYLPGPRGGPPPVGFRNASSGRLIFANQAPAGSSYFVLKLGTPADADYAVDVRITGPATENERVTGRNFWRDLDRLTRFVQGQPPEQRRNTTVRVAAPVLPDRWIAGRRRVVAPEYAVGGAADDTEVRPDFAKVRGAQLAGPTWLQTVNGTLGSGVWVAGVITGTMPMMALVPRGGGEPLAPQGEAQRWVTTGSPMTLASFSFPPLPAGATYDARYWHDARRAVTAPPDATFPVVAP